MTAAKFRSAVAHLSLTLTALSRHLRVDRRTVHRWASGESPIPEAVALLLTAWVQHPNVMPPGKAK